MKPDKVERMREVVDKALREAGFDGDVCPFCHGTGRKLYQSAAERQRAYRERKKAKEAK